MNLPRKFIYRNKIICKFPLNSWIGINPGLIRLSGKLFQNGQKVKNIGPDVPTVNEVNRITVLKMELENQVLFNVKVVNERDDIDQMKKFRVGGQVYHLYKFLRVKTFKRLIAFENNIIGQWPSIHDAGNGKIFADLAEIDSISSNLMIIWSPIMNKIFKVGLEGSLTAKVEKDISCSIYDNGETPIVVDAKIYSVWNVEAMNLYLNMLTGLKNRNFIIVINGLMWNDKSSIGSKKPQIIRVIPDQSNLVHRVMCIVNLEALNVHSVNLKFGGQYLNLMAHKNITLGQAFAMWCLLGINIPSFSYIQVDGRKLTEYEYNVETLDHWPWSKSFILMKCLNGGISDEIFNTMKSL
jgi:hypothetical protein